jgi:hypothetical protein
MVGHLIGASSMTIGSSALSMLKVNVRGQHTALVIVSKTRTVHRAIQVRQ